MKTIFISMPMAGKTLEEITQERDMLIEQACEVLNDKVMVIESIFECLDDKHIKNPPLWCLGHSLKYLAYADVAVFAKDWQSARGCRIEYESCIQYGVKTVILE